MPGDISFLQKNLLDFKLPDFQVCCRFRWLHHLYLNLSKYLNFSDESTFINHSWIPVPTLPQNDKITQATRFEMVISVNYIILMFLYDCALCESKWPIFVLPRCFGRLSSTCKPCCWNWINPLDFYTRDLSDIFKCTESFLSDVELYLPLTWPLAFRHLKWKVLK